MAGPVPSSSSAPHTASAPPVETAPEGIHAEKAPLPTITNADTCAGQVVSIVCCDNSERVSILPKIGKKLCSASIFLASPAMAVAGYFGTKSDNPLLNHLGWAGLIIGTSFSVLELGLIICVSRKNALDWNKKSLEGKQPLISQSQTQYQSA